MTTRLVHGFDRLDHRRQVHMLVEADLDSDFDTAGGIAGAQFCFHASQGVAPRSRSSVRGSLNLPQSSVGARACEEAG
jgi:hypothetical protein